MTTRVVPFDARFRPGQSVEAGAPSSDAASALVGPDGLPARIPKNAKCPQCGAGADQRVSSGGFGEPHDVCRQCGYEAFMKVG